MKVFFKIFIAALIAGVWYHIGGTGAGITALALFAFMLVVLLLKPVSFQSPEKREDYMRQLKKKRERRLALQAKQKEEQFLLYKASKEREERKKRELHNKLKNR